LKYVKFSIAVIIILFVVLGILNGIVQSIILPRTSTDTSSIMVDVILYLLPLVTTYLLIQYSWKKIVKEAEPSETDEKAKNMLKGVNQTINAVLKKEDSVTVSDEEESIYEQVAEELANNIKKEGLWLKAVEQAEGDDRKIKPLYIKYRVQSIKTEQKNDLARTKETLEKEESTNIKDLVDTEEDTNIKKTYTKLDVFFNPDNYTESEKKDILGGDYDDENTIKKE